MTSKKDKQLTKVGCYRQLFNSENGKTILLDLMKRYRLMSASHITDTNKLNYLEGQRSVVLYIMSMKDTDLKELEEMFNEAVNDDDYQTE